MTTAVFAALVGLAGATACAPGCDRECQSNTPGVSCEDQSYGGTNLSCDGNVLVSVGYSCTKGRFQKSAPKRDDCGAKACVEGEEASCVATCKGDGDCDSTDHCDANQHAYQHAMTCLYGLPTGAACTPGGLVPCREGAVCTPDPSVMVDGGAARCSAP